MQYFLGAHPTVLPLVLVVAALSAVFARPLGTWLGCSRVAAGLLLLAVLGPLALALGPSLPLDVGAGRGCDTFVRPPRWWGRGGEELGNVALLAPLGFLTPLLLRPRQAAVVLLLAAGVTFFIELTQYAMPVLGRECDLTDIVLNSLGLAAAAAVGVAARLVLSRARRPGAAGPSGSDARPDRSGARSR